MKDEAGGGQGAEAGGKEPGEPRQTAEESGESGRVKEENGEPRQAGAETEGSRSKESADGGEAAGGGEAEVLTPEEQLSRAEGRAKDYYAHLQRLQAEFDNYRKRTVKEKEETVKYAAERIVASLLPVLDNFERAVAASRTNRDFDSFAQGVEMIFRQMQAVLVKEGLTEIKAVGETFDPKLHEAVMQIDSEDHPGNTVVEELQKGYYLKDKVLRPTMVKVSR
ncbi:nucleotide exchange factor GrpE [Acididesulfobacillus acetoxydans]|uniref:nucleotide exchange factor GrpE n=1 Tax=Acididesulfobacillus acetoxydans TaxID=1561005 RepID=UPI00355650FB